VPRAKRSPNAGADPVVDEIRAIRARMWKQGGGTAEGYLKLMTEMAEKRATSGKKRSSVRGKRRAATPAPRKRRA